MANVHELNCETKHSNFSSFLVYVCRQCCLISHVWWNKIQNKWKIHLFSLVKCLCTSIKQNLLSFLSIEEISRRKTGRKESDQQKKLRKFITFCTTIGSVYHYKCYICLKVFIVQSASTTFVLFVFCVCVCIEMHRWWNSKMFFGNCYHFKICSQFERIWVRSVVCYSYRNSNNQIHN